MNKENTKKAIEVMQAYLDGKSIEWRWIGEPEWKDVEVEANGPNWLWSNCTYRVKTEPMEIEVWVSPHGERSLFKPHSLGNLEWIKKKFREVLDE